MPEVADELIELIERVAGALTEEQANRLLSIALGVKVAKLLERGIQSRVERLEILRRWIDDLLLDMEQKEEGL